MIIPLLLLLALGLFLTVWFLLNSPPEQSAALLVKVAPLFLVAIGVALTLLGRGMVGVPLALIGLSWRRRAQAYRRPSSAAGGRRSVVRTAALAMELDHDSGAMDGEVLTGHFQGARLSSLSEAELFQLSREVAADQESLALLEAYLDRRFPNWREGAEQNKFRDKQGSGGSAGSARMSQEDAWEILGLAPGASREEIHQAWRRLMKGVHPDSGGSAYLAAKINAAKEILLASQGRESDG